MPLGLRELRPELERRADLLAPPLHVGTARQRLSGQVLTAREDAALCGECQEVRRLDKLHVASQDEREERVEVSILAPRGRTLPVLRAVRSAARVEHVCTV